MVSTRRSQALRVGSNTVSTRAAPTASAAPADPEIPIPTALDIPTTPIAPATPATSRKVVKKIRVPVVPAPNVRNPMFGSAAL